MYRVQTLWKEDFDWRLPCGVVFWSLSSCISLHNNLLDEIINATELTIQEKRLPEICCKGPCSNNISLRMAYEFQDWWAINKSNPASMFECLKYYGNVVHWAKYMILVRPSLKESSTQMMQTFYVSGVTDPWKSMVWQRTHWEWFLVVGNQLCLEDDDDVFTCFWLVPDLCFFLPDGLLTDVSTQPLKPRTPTTH